MDMGIVKARGHQLTAQVSGFSTVADQFFDLFIGADRQDLVAFDGDGLYHGGVRFAGPYLPIKKYGISIRRWFCIAGHGQEQYARGDQKFYFVHFYPGVSNIKIYNKCQAAMIQFLPILCGLNSDTFEPSTSIAGAGRVP